MAEISKSGFYMKIFRSSPSDRMPDGGVGIFVKAARLEEIFRGNSENDKEGPWQNTWFWRDNNLTRIAPYRTTFAIDYRLDSQLFSSESNLYHMFPLRMVGITEGAVVHIPGVHPKQYLQAYANAAKQVVSHLYANFLKPLTIELNTAESEAPIDFNAGYQPNVISEDQATANNSRFNAQLRAMMNSGIYYSGQEPADPPW